MTWIFYAQSDDEKRTSTYVAWYEIRVEVPIIVIVDILTPTNYLVGPFLTLLVVH